MSPKVLIPKKQRALVVLDDSRSLGVSSDKPVPTINLNELLVCVKAVSLNPIDQMKLYGGSHRPGDSIGCDFAGVVVDVGAEAATKHGFKIGDGVAGFINGGTDDIDNGSFSEYLKVRSDIVWKKPDSITFEDAAAMGIAFLTAAWSLFWYLGLPKPWGPPSNEDWSKRPILIWAGSTSVGLNAIPLAKLVGLPVITTGSPKNHALLKSLGADLVLDYSDPSVIEKIKEWVQEKGYEDITVALDSITKDRSTELIAKAFGPKGGKINKMLSDEPDERLPPGVEAGYTILFHIIYEARREAFAAGQELYRNLPELVLTRGVNNAVPLQRLDGLVGIPKGLELLKNRQVSAHKLVARIDDTEGKQQNSSFFGWLWGSKPAN